MKKRIIILPFITFLFALGSCESPFDRVFNKVEEVEIQDNHNAYVVGDVFKTVSEFVIYARYTDDSYKELTYNNVVFTLECEGKSYSPDKAFTKAGEYVVTAHVGAIKSNAVTINVYSKHVYATDVAADTYSLDIKTMEENSFDIEVTPSNFTEEIVVESDRETTIIEKVNKTAFYFYEEETGTTTITIKVKCNANDYVSTTLKFTVAPASPKIDIEQTYTPIPCTAYRQYCFTPSNPSYRNGLLHSFS